MKLSFNIDQYCEISLSFVSFHLINAQISHIPTAGPVLSNADEAM